MLQEYSKEEVVDKQHVNCSNAASASSNSDQGRGLAAGLWNPDTISLTSANMQIESAAVNVRGTQHCAAASSTAHGEVQVDEASNCYLSMR
jgi:hypothetical protein